MNCWKTINLSRDIGNHRLFIASFIVAFAAFIIMYLPLSIINESVRLNDNRFLIFFASLLMIIPLHTICHAIPAWFAFKKTKLAFKKCPYFIFTIKIIFLDSMSKSLKMFSILAPTLFITIPLIGCAILYPHYMHYFTMTAALNIGLSVIDFIYFIALIKAPKKCMIEHRNHTFDILIKG